MAKYEDKKPPTEKTPPAEKKSKSDYLEGMSTTTGMKAARELGLLEKGKEGELYRFLKKKSPAALGLLLGNTKNDVRDVKNPDYVPPILASQIEDYRKHTDRYDKHKGRNTEDVSGLTSYLTSNKYNLIPEKSKRKAQSGQWIIDQAKKMGAKLEQNEDGTFTMYDDITTFRDSDQGYGKGRIIDPNAKYNMQRYQRGNDLVNVYNFAEPPTYKDRVPTEAEMTSYDEGNRNFLALTPEYKKYYASAYLDPSSKGDERTMFYGQNTNVEDIDRNKEVADLRARLAPVNERKIRMRKIMDKLTPDFNLESSKPWQDRLSELGGYAALPIVGLGAAYTAPVTMTAGMLSPLIGAGVGRLIDKAKTKGKR